MAGIDDVLERLITDDAFRAQLATDPDTALTGYDLTDEDRALLASHVSNDAGQAGKLEGRTSKAGLFGLLGGLDEIAEAVVAADGDAPIQPPQSDFEFVGERADDGSAAAGDKGSHRGEIDVQTVDWGTSQQAMDDEHEIEMTVEAGESEEPPWSAEVLRARDDASDPSGEATTMTSIALAESGGTTGGDDSSESGGWIADVEHPAEEPAGTPAPGGGTMATDDWEEQTAAGEDGTSPDEKITIHGQYDMPSPAEEERVPGPAQLADVGPSAERFAGWPVKWELSELDASTAEAPPVEPESATVATDEEQAKPSADRGADAPMSYENKFQAIPDDAPEPDADEVAAQDDSAAQGNAHVAISLGDHQTIEADAAVGASTPSADHDDPDQFDVSEMFEWASSSADTPTAAADVGVTPNAAPDGAVPDEDAAAAPTSDT